MFHVHATGIIKHCVIPTKRIKLIKAASGAHVKALLQWISENCVILSHFSWHLRQCLMQMMFSSDINRTHAIGLKISLSPSIHPRLIVAFLLFHPNLCFLFTFRCLQSFHTVLFVSHLQDNCHAFWNSHTLSSWHTHTHTHTHSFSTGLWILWRAQTGF